jgi:cytochrome c556
VNSIITRYNYKQSEEFIWNTMKNFTKHAKKFNDTAEVFADRAEKWVHKVDSLKMELKQNKNK